MKGNAQSLKDKRTHFNLCSTSAAQVVIETISVALSAPNSGPSCFSTAPPRQVRFRVVVDWFCSALCLCFQVLAAAVSFILECWERLPVLQFIRICQFAYRNMLGARCHGFHGFTFQFVYWSTLQLRRAHNLGSVHWNFFFATL